MAFQYSNRDLNCGHETRFDLTDKSDKSCQIMDVVIPKDGRVRSEKKDEKVEKYQDTAREVPKLRGIRSKVSPVVVGN